MLPSYAICGSYGDLSEIKVLKLFITDIIFLYTWHISVVRLKMLVFVQSTKFVNSFHQQNSLVFHFVIKTLIAFFLIKTLILAIHGISDFEGLGRLATRVKMFKW